jgi:hypothetical protein
MLRGLKTGLAPAVPAAFVAPDLPRDRETVPPAPQNRAPAPAPEGGRIPRRVQDRPAAQGRSAKEGGGPSRNS